MIITQSGLTKWICEHVQPCPSVQWPHKVGMISNQKGTKRSSCCQLDLFQTSQTYIYIYVGNKSFVSYILVTSNSIVLVSYWLNMSQSYCQRDPHRLSCPPQWRHLFPPTDFSPLASAEVPTKCPKSFPGLSIEVSENVPLMMSGTCFFLFFSASFSGVASRFHVSSDRLQRTEAMATRTVSLWDPGRRPCLAWSMDEPGAYLKGKWTWCYYLY